MDGLLKINVPRFIFLALSYIFAKNKCSFIYFSSIFLKIVLKINVHLSLFRCHVCTVVNERSRIVYIAEKAAHQHAQNVTFGLFAATLLFRLIGWFHIHLYLFI